MPDWKRSMQQTFEYYVVDPGTWKDTTKITVVKTSTINRDAEVETLGSASIDVTDLLGECYIRIYLVTNQNGIEEKHPLGTFLVQTPSSNFDGKIREVTMDAYTPLLEMKENQPPLGYAILKNENIMDNAYRICDEQTRAPVVKPECSETLYNDFVANTDDTYLSFTRDLMANAKYNLNVDEMGRVLFAPQQETASLQPVATFDDGNSSILHPPVTITHDIFDIPNVVEVIYTNGSTSYHAIVKNEDPNSPTSIVNRGREIKHRDTNPSMMGIPSELQVKDYAERLLKEMSTVEYMVTFTHGYYPVRLGDCVRLDYKRAGLNNVKAKVISQSIKCEPGCPVTAKAVYTAKLWG